MIRHAAAGLTFQANIDENLIFIFTSWRSELVRCECKMHVF